MEDKGKRKKSDWSIVSQMKAKKEVLMKKLNICIGLVMTCMTLGCAEELSS